MNKVTSIVLVLSLFIGGLFLIKAENKEIKYQIIQGSYKNSNYTLLKIRNKSLEFRISKPIYDDKTKKYYFKGQKTSEFLIESKSDIAINTSPYFKKDDFFYSIGLYIYNKKLISEKSKNYGEIIIKNNIIILNPNEKEIKNADYGFSGFFVLIKNNKYIKNFKEKKDPRTIIGTDKNNKYLYLITIEGRGINSSQGISLNEAIDFSLEQGISNVINLDGGGSSTLIVKKYNHPEKLNSTSNIFDQERIIPFHLGIKIIN